MRSFCTCDIVGETNWYPAKGGTFFNYFTVFYQFELGRFISLSLCVRNGSQRTMILLFTSFSARRIRVKSDKLQNRWTDRMFALTHCMTVINFNIIPLATEYLQQLARIISTNYTQHVPVWLNDSIQVLRRYFSLMVWDAVKSLGMRNEMTVSHVNANAHPTNDHNNEQQNPNYFTFQIVSHSQQPSRALAGAREWVLKEKRMFEAHGIAL